MELAFWPRIHHCCCCIPLKLGAVLIGVVSVVVSLVSLAGACVSLYKVVWFAARAAGGGGGGGGGAGAGAGGHSREEVRRGAVALYLAHAYLMLVLVYYFAISLFLLVGLARNKSSYLRRYFNLALALLLLALALVVVAAGAAGPLAALPVLKWCVTLFYCLVVVRSACLQLEERQPPPFELKTIHSTQRAQHAPLL